MTLSAFLGATAKIILATFGALVFMVCFVIDPVTFKHFHTEEDDAPVGGSFIVNAIYLSPITTRYFCEVTDSKLHMELVRKEGYKFQLGSLPEPYGSLNGHRVETSSVRHSVPKDVAPGDRLIMKREVKFDCIFRNRSVYSEETSLTVKDVEPSSETFGPSPLAPSVPQTRGEYLRVPEEISNK